VAGAAAATVIGQWLGAGVGLVLNRRYNHEIRLRWKGWRPNGETVGTIYRVGLPVFFTNSLGSVMTFAMNAVLLGHSATAVAFFGIYYKLQNFLFMPVNGLGQAAIPIVSYNLGAKAGARIRKTVSTALTASVAFALAASACSLCLPGRYCSSSTPGRRCLPSACRVCASSPPPSPWQRPPPSWAAPGPPWATR
jgi:Na+-driven multidrug efflux pump